MSLDLDKRHRAMLREMGVRVWLPQTPVAQAPADVAVIDDAPAAAVATAPAAHTPAPVAASPAPRASVAPVVPVSSPAPAPRPPAPAARPASAPASRAEPREGVAVTWRMGAPVSLYADTPRAPGPCWLVLAETPAAALQAEPFNPFAGDAGKLLDNMLRAARLPQAGAVLLAPLSRHAAAGADSGLPAELPALIASAQPDVVLVMGRLAAQALLQSSEVFGKLRGQVHQLHGAPLVLTYDAPYLLRNQPDKAKAWDDLCLAMSLVPAP